MKNKVKIIFLFVLFAILSFCIYFFIISNSARSKQKEYNLLVEKLCNVTLNLAKERPEVVPIDKDVAGSYKYVTFLTLSGATIDSEERIPISIENPLKTTEAKPVYFAATTRVKISINASKKLICDGLVDIGNAPKISLIGSEMLAISKGAAYNEPGYLAKDKEDGDITNKVIKNGIVDVDNAGKYELFYFVQDSMGNIVSKKRIVTVK